MYLYDKIPYSWKYSQRYFLYQATQLVGIKNVNLIPDCVAAALEHRHYKMMIEPSETVETTMFLDFGASHLACYIAQYQNV